MESRVNLQEALVNLDIETWQPEIDAASSARLAEALELGKVLQLTQLPPVLSTEEKVFLSPDWLSGNRKNISLEGDRVGGARGTPDELARIGAMMKRHSERTTELVTCLFPDYIGQLKRARTSLRPSAVRANTASYKKDDTRLHVDAFPSRPNQGERILRVFTKLNPDGIPRVWRVGEPFEDAARYFLPKIHRPFPGSAALLRALKITKGHRSEYDHIMLRMHDEMKADLDYQKNSPQLEVAFQPGTTWICFSDQVLHAAMSGQFMFEQTFHIPVAAQYHPEFSPLRVLERLKGRSLVS